MFKYCPQCTSPDIEIINDKQLICPSCQFTYFHNAPAAVMCVLVFQGQILLSVRNMEPAKGFLDLVGGFIDPGENAEQALTRELHEELGIVVSDFTYLGSATNDYHYKSILYKTCDLVYFSQLKKVPVEFDQKEIRELVLFYPDQINKKDIGFKSVHSALKLYESWCERS